jgi:restriction endonuclease
VIFSNAPADWSDLEMRVCQVLTECGCEAERNRHIDLARGGANIDVCAVDRTREPRLVILCECKHWNSRVPQTVVHAFRTVVHEAGAHVGYIISSAGFQPGAIEGAVGTNVHLVTWEEFQEVFYERWFDAMDSGLQAVGREVADLADYFHPRTTSVLHAIPERVEELQTLHRRFSAYNFVSIRAFMRRKIDFPLTLEDPRPGAEDGAKITFTDARSYFDTLLACAQPAIEAYEQFIAKYQAEDAKAGRAPD